MVLLLDEAVPIRSDRPSVSQWKYHNEMNRACQEFSLCIASFQDYKLDMALLMSIIVRILELNVCIYQKRKRDVSKYTLKTRPV